MSVRSILCASVIFAALAHSCLAQSVTPPPPITGGGVQGLNLQTQLEKGLMARRPVEFAYIEAVVKLVEDGKLPYKLVATTYLWAQRKPVLKVQYFQAALETRARKLHVTLPGLNTMAVGTRSNGGEHGVNTPPNPGTSTLTR